MSDLEKAIGSKIIRIEKSNRYRDNYVDIYLDNGKCISIIVDDYQRNIFYNLA